MSRLFLRPFGQDSTTKEEIVCCVAPGIFKTSSGNRIVIPYFQSNLKTGVSA
ncbi:hypothetical protein [Methanolobus sp. ZRKC5]|uniref:hypothetical protein n=1 Tax=unclassified Methanolobus TaxID=2629569 RepID=UPI00313F0F78